MNQRPAYLDGKAAAEMLGVKRETLYAYASRGLVRSEPGSRGRERRYRRDDLERLKARHDARSGHGAVAAGALRWGEPVLESALTAIEPAGPVYRGLAAVELSRSTPFEAVAEMLWASAAPAPGAILEAPPWRPAGLGIRVAPLGSLLPAGSPPLTALSLAVPALAAADRGRFDASPDAERARARALVKRMAALVGLGLDRSRAAAALDEPTVAGALLSSLGVRGGKKAEQAVNRTLVLCADHELNPSTFAVRITASTRADLYACFAAGLGALSGPRHGGEVDRVAALVAEAGRPEGARAVIHDRARRGDEIPGFGHTLYPEGDPRAPPLLETALGLGSKSPTLRTLLAILAAAREADRPPPTLDFGLVAVSAALELPPGSSAALFAVGRAAGWIAHAFEQRAAGFLLRPRARYVGPVRAP